MEQLAAQFSDDPERILPEPGPLESAKSYRENKALRGIVADFERVKRAFGPEEVERAVEDARRREAQKEAKRKFSRGAR